MTDITEEMIDDDFYQAVKDLYEELKEKQKPLDEDIVEIIYDNIEELYEK